MCPLFHDTWRVDFFDAPFLIGSSTMSNADTAATTTWPDLAIGLYDRLTGRNAEITYEADNLEIEVPSDTSDSASHAKWRVSGTLRIRTRDNA